MGQSPRKMPLLLVEDDPHTAGNIVTGLAEAGHIGNVLRNGQDALFAATRNFHDVIIADRMIPGLDVPLIHTVRNTGYSLHAPT